MQAHTAGSRSTMHLGLYISRSSGAAQYATSDIYTHAQQEHTTSIRMDRYRYVMTETCALIATDTAACDGSQTRMHAVNHVCMHAYTSASMRPDSPVCNQCRCGTHSDRDKLVGEHSVSLTSTIFSSLHPKCRH